LTERGGELNLEGKKRKKKGGRFTSRKAIQFVCDWKGIITGKSSWKRKGESGGAINYKVTVGGMQLH